MLTIKAGMGAGLVGVAVVALLAPTAPSANNRSLSTAPAVVCGSDSTSGLGVSASRADGCSTALQVASAYMHRVWSKPATGATTVDVAGSTWKCQEQRGEPNPYDKCVNMRDSRQWVTLTS
ncbi:hypothetical protein ACFV2N_22550 [Streptomyces sp. NPDC059680]|uniref:hypothetical protein n=1 Tax=Streptomyces sp. NPDC059680 TaxID=3346904 RepID=UPI0036A13A68